MISKDNFICQIVNILFKFVNLFKISRKRLLMQSKLLFNQYDFDDKLYIILNGPSLKQQDISVLNGKCLLFVNRGFHHPLYSQLKPRFHMFIDPKMLSGEWDLNWLYEIREMVPDIIFLLPVSWAFKPQLKPYMYNNEFKIIWIDDSTPATLLGVGGYSIKYGIDFNFQKIFFTGFEATGLAHEIINGQSHFYGVNKENLIKNSDDYISDLYMFSRHLNDLKQLSIVSKSMNIEIINFTDGGILDMFERKKIHEICS